LEVVIPSLGSEFVLNGIDGVWVDDPTKRRWRREWSREIDELIAQLDN
jgi:adenosine deaminase